MERSSFRTEKNSDTSRQCFENLLAAGAFKNFVWRWSFRMALNFTSSSDSCVGLHRCCAALDSHFFAFLLHLSCFFLDRLAGRSVA